jgi:hypothetical protein
MFEVTWCPHLQELLELKIEALLSLEMSGTTHPATKRHNYKELNAQDYQCSGTNSTK